MKENKISVLVLVENNIQTLERTLKSVQDFDEIVVIDGGSTDGSVELAKKWGANVIANKFEGFTKQRNFSLIQANYRWALVVDSDEEVTPSLREELYSIIHQKNPAKLYRIMRTEYLLGEENKYGYGRSNYQERFFQIDHVRYEGELHEYPLVDGRKPKLVDSDIINLPSHLRLHHNPENCVDFVLDRFARYSRLKAQEKILKGRNVRLLELIFSFPLSFTQIFLRRFRAGRIGVVEALIESAHRLFVKLLIYEYGLKSSREKKNEKRKTSCQ